jgi:transcriptional regulator with XRE-family HTH domain
MLLRYAIGAALRRIRLQRRLTLREVATAARVSMPYLSEIERGRKEPSSEIVAGISTALGLTLVDLLREVHDEAFVVDIAERREARLAAPASTAPASTAPTSTAPTSTAPTSTAPTSTAPTSISSDITNVRLAA